MSTKQNYPISWTSVLSNFHHSDLVLTSVFRQPHICANLNNRYIPFSVFMFFVTQRDSKIFRWKNLTQISLPYSIRFSALNLQKTFFGTSRMGARFSNFPGIRVGVGVITLGYDAILTMERLNNWKMKYNPFVPKKYSSSYDALGELKTKIEVEHYPYLTLVVDSVPVPLSNFTREDGSIFFPEEIMKQKLTLLVASDIHKQVKNTPIYSGFYRAVEKGIIQPLLEEDVKVLYCPSEFISRNVFKGLSYNFKSTDKKEDFVKNVVATIFSSPFWETPAPVPIPVQTVEEDPSPVVVDGATYFDATFGNSYTFNENYEVSSDGTTLESGGRPLAYGVDPARLEEVTRETFSHFQIPVSRTAADFDTALRRLTETEREASGLYEQSGIRTTPTPAFSAETLEQFLTELVEGVTTAQAETGRIQEDIVGEDE